MTLHRDEFFRLLLMEFMRSYVSAPQSGKEHQCRERMKFVFVRVKKKNLNEKKIYPDQGYLYTHAQFPFNSIYQHIVKGTTRIN